MALSSLDVSKISIDVTFDQWCHWRKYVVCSQTKLERVNQRSTSWLRIITASHSRSSPQNSFSSRFSKSKTLVHRHKLPRRGSMQPSKFRVVKAPPHFLNQLRLIYLIVLNSIGEYGTFGHFEI